MDPILEHRLAINRREFFGRGASAIGTAALASLLSRDGLAGNTRFCECTKMPPSHCLLWRLSDYRYAGCFMHSTPRCLSVNLYAR